MTSSSCTTRSSSCFSVIKFVAALFLLIYSSSSSSPDASLDRALDGLRAAILRAHCSTSRFLHPDACAQVFSSHSQPFSRAHRSTSRCPPSAAYAQVHSSHLQPCARAHCSISRCPSRAACLQTVRLCHPYNAGLDGRRWVGYSTNVSHRLINHWTASNSFIAPRHARFTPASATWSDALHQGSTFASTTAGTSVKRRPRDERFRLPICSRMMRRERASQASAPSGELCPSSQDFVFHSNSRLKR